jgi:hypothetical protein
MKRFVITLALICGVIEIPACAQQALFGSIIDAPQHIFAVGGGCDGNKQCSADFGYAEKISGSTYSYSSVEFVPNLVPNGNGGNTLSVKPVVGTGAEQIIGQSDRLSVAIGVTGGASLPSPNSGAFNFASSEHITIAWRLNKTLNTMPGTGNNYLSITPYFTQISGQPNGNTLAVRIHFLHSAN